MPSPAERFRTLFLRLATVVYDTLVLVALWIFATALLMPLTGGAIDPPLPWNIPFDLYIFAVSYLYLGGLWHRTGQTLGMRAWRLKLVNENGALVSWRAALIRVLAAMLSWLLLGAGWLWILFDRDGMALHDRLSGTRVVRVAKVAESDSD